MKYVRRTKKEIKTNFLEELLKDRGVLKENWDLENFLSPTRENLLNPLDLDNMEKGFKCFKKHLENGSRFYFVVDCDVDGFSSSSTLINYMNDYLKALFPNFSIEYYTPEGKAHGLETIMNIFTKEKICDLIILPDSSSNDYQWHEELKKLGYDILVLD